MANHDRLIAEANRRRSDDTRLGPLTALTFLARCFSLGEHGDCVAAMFGQPRQQQEAAEDVLADEKTQNDGNLEGDEGPNLTCSMLRCSYWNYRPNTLSLYLTVTRILMWNPKTLGRCTARQHYLLMLNLKTAWRLRIAFPLQLLAKLRLH